MGFPIQEAESPKQGLLEVTEFLAMLAYVAAIMP